MFFKKPFANFFCVAAGGLGRRRRSLRDHGGRLGGSGAPLGMFDNG